MDVKNAIFCKTEMEPIDLHEDSAVDEAVRVLMSTGAVRIKIPMSPKQRLHAAIDTPSCVFLINPAG